MAGTKFRPPLEIVGGKFVEEQEMFHGDVTPVGLGSSIGMLSALEKRASQQDVLAAFVVRRRYQSGRR
jgi:hypothetical protein